MPFPAWTTVILAAVCLLGCNEKQAVQAQDQACGGYQWGNDWPGSTRAKHEIQILEPKEDLLSCGPGCRQVTTRLNFATAQPYEFHFAGKHMVSRAHKLEPGKINWVDLESAQEYELAVAPSPTGKGHGFVQVMMGEGSVAKQMVLIGEETRRSLVCQVSLTSNAQRLLAQVVEKTNVHSRDIAPVAADERYVVLNQSGKLWAIDTHDGSSHQLDTRGSGISRVSVVPGYIVYSNMPGELVVVDTADWSRRRLDLSGYSVRMAVSDGEHVVWIDGPGPEGKSARVAVHSLETGKTVRLEHGKPPSNKFHPDIEGDWVVWVDDRDSNAPNSPPDKPRDRLDVYGIRLSDGKEIHLAGPGTPAEKILFPMLPRLHGGKLYVVGRAGKNAQLFEITLPED